MTAVPTLALSMIYCLWQAYRRALRRRERTLRERVAYMLWVMAARVGDEPEPQRNADARG